MSQYIISMLNVHKGNIAFAGLIGGTVAFLLLVFGSQAYTVQTDYLVIQKGAESQDFYTLSKSVEYSGNVLKESIASNLFLNEAIETQYFNSALFSGDERSRLKSWRKAVEVKQRTSAGILEVTVKHQNRSEAMGIARAISEVLITKNALFRSGDADSIAIKSISGPIVEQSPTPQKLLAGAIAGVILGAALAVLKILRTLKREDEKFAQKIKEQKDKEQELRERSPFMQEAA